MKLTLTEISSEDARLAKDGLVLRDGHFLKETPFQPPWTSHSLLMPSDWPLGPSRISMLLGQKRVRADLLRLDLDTLEAVMQRGYGGWDSAARRGWNWAEWFSDWRRQLASKGTGEIPIDEAFAPVDALKEFQKDNHTLIPIERSSMLDGDSSQTALLETMPSSRCDEVRSGNQIHEIPVNDPAQQVKVAYKWAEGASELTRAAYISMPRSHGVPQAVHCGAAWIELKPASAGHPALALVRMAHSLLRNDHMEIERLGKGILYARLPTFIRSNYHDASSGELPHRESTDRVLIIDLRNNHGGSIGYGLEALSRLIDEDRMVPWTALGKELTSSCLYAALRWNGQLALSPQALSEDKAFLQNLLDQMSQPYPLNCPRTVDKTIATWIYSQHHFSPKSDDMRIVALVNNGCGSDCELLTAELASLRETIVVGTNTFGIAQFIQPGYSVLPHTSLPYSISLGESDFYGDRRSFDGYGLDVDIIIPDIDGTSKDHLRHLAELIAHYASLPSIPR